MMFDPTCQKRPVMELSSWPIKRWSADAPATATAATSVRWTLYFSHSPMRSYNHGPIKLAEMKAGRATPTNFSHNRQRSKIG